MYIYYGSDEFSLAVLKGLCAVKPPLAVVTQPDRPAGRQQKLRPGPLALFAKEQALPLIQPESLRLQEDQDKILRLGGSLHIVVSFGQILPKSFLARTSTIINGHASLLPKYRGASPIQSVLLNGESETGMTIMHIVPALDAGPMISKKTVSILSEDNHQSLSLKLIEAAIELLIPFIEGEPVPEGEAQDEADSTHCSKLSKEDAQLHPEEQPAHVMDRIIRAFAPKPGAYFFYETAKGSKRLKVLKVEKAESQSGSGLWRQGRELFLGDAQGEVLRVLDVQPEGKGVMRASDFLNGIQGELKLS